METDTPNEYTFIVEWDTFCDARRVTNNSRMDSQVGTVSLVARLQKKLEYWLSLNFMLFMWMVLSPVSNIIEQICEVMGYPVQFL